MILVTGATGKFGGSTAEYLQHNDIPFIAAARNAETLKKRFSNSAGIVTFDWDRSDTFGQALKGIDTVSIMPPPVVTNNFHKQAKPFVEEARKAGVSHIVQTTALYSDHRDSLFYGTEALVKESGIDFTIVRPSFVFQNFLNQFLEGVRNGILLAPSDKGRTSYVDIRNVGEATAAILASPTMHKGKIYSITGPQALTHSEMADILSKELSRSVAHVSPSVENYKKRLAELNVPAFLHDFLGELYTSIAKGQWNIVSDDYRTLTGNEPTGFSEFVKENRDVFQEQKKQKA